MTKQYFKELAAYNVWANNIVCNWLEQINEGQWSREIVSSFNTIQETVLHIISAEKAWLERFEQQTNIAWLQFEYKGTKDEHIALWKSTSSKLKSFIDEFDETKLQSNLTFRRLNGDEYSMPYYELFAHVINHGSYHRGQLVTMLRQAGFASPGSTDLLNYYRIK